MDLWNDPSSSEQRDRVREIRKLGESNDEKKPTDKEESTAAPRDDDENDDVDVDIGVDVDNDNDNDNSIEVKEKRREIEKSPLGQPAADLIEFQLAKEPHIHSPEDVPPKKGRELKSQTMLVETSTDTPAVDLEEQRFPKVIDKRRPKGSDKKRKSGKERRECAGKFKNSGGGNETKIVLPGGWHDIKVGGHTLLQKYISIRLRYECETR